MKTISFDIPDNLYNSFREFIKLLPKKIKVYAEDLDELTLEEKAEVYKLKEKTDSGIFSDFDEWEDIKEDI